jgi:hypothetical protein
MRCWRRRAGDSLAEIERALAASGGRVRGSSGKR